LYFGLAKNRAGRYLTIHDDALRASLKAEATDSFAGRRRVTFNVKSCEVLHDAFALRIGEVLFIGTPRFSLVFPVFCVDAERESQHTRGPCIACRSARNNLKGVHDAARSCASNIVINHCSGQRRRNSGGRNALVGRFITGPIFLTPSFSNWVKEAG